MIIEWLCDLACSVLMGLFNTLEFISLPIDAISTLANIMCFGTWVVGSDIMLLFTASVTLWLGAKMSFGLALRLWELLPFT